MSILFIPTSDIWHPWSVWDNILFNVCVVNVSFLVCFQYPFTKVPVGPLVMGASKREAKKHSDIVCLCPCMHEKEGRRCAAFMKHSRSILNEVNQLP